MTSTPSCDRPSEPQPPPAPAQKGTLKTAFLLLGLAWLISQSDLPVLWRRSIQTRSPVPAIAPLPLAMSGGDPHVRALMRTISAAESNTMHPYHTLYGGQPVTDLSQHPDLCVEIVAGPNQGDCTTAAGRYQFLTTTWQEIAAAYHPEPPQWYSWWGDYSFEPVFQDAVVHQWLSDPAAWGADIPELLRQERLEEVLYLLSETWTSLGYGIEDNLNTPYLGQIYQAVLTEELAATP